jgi:hypothetical protein
MIIVEIMVENIKSDNQQKTQDSAHPITDNNGIIFVAGSQKIWLILFSPRYSKLKLKAMKKLLISNASLLSKAKGSRGAKKKVRRIKSKNLL